MKERIVKLHKTIKDWLTQVLFKKYLTPLALVFVYIFIVGITSIVAKIFFRKSLSKSSGKRNSNWIEVQDYEGSLEDSLKQS